MGEYAPDDQRSVHKSDDGSWQSQEQQQQGEGAQPGDQQQALDAQVGGPRPEYDQYEVNQAGNINKQVEAQRGYGNARDEDGQMEQDVATGNLGRSSFSQDDSAQPGEISDRPDERAAADASRPLGES